MPDDDRNSPGTIYLDLLQQGHLQEGKHWVCRHYRNQEFIIKRGERSLGRLFLVRSGTVRVVGYVEVAADSHVRPGMKDLGPGEVFGEISLLDPGEHKSGIMSVGDSEIIAIDGDALLDFLDRNPELGCRFFRSLCGNLARRLRRADQQIFNLLGWALSARGYGPHLRDSDR